MKRRLYRSETESVIGGVAGGVAEYLDADPAIVRVVWALLALITGGVFLIIYIVMWIVVPYGPESGEVAAGDSPAPDGAPAAMESAARPPRAARLRGRSWVFGLVLVVLGSTSSPGSISQDSRRSALALGWS
jgi:phage shock protein PspC (stress-responsive transcriptional regulator)